MKSVVAAEAWMEYGVMLVVVLFVGGVDGLHAEVEAENEVVEVEAQAQTIADGQLTRKVAESELPARLNVVVA